MEFLNKIILRGIVGRCSENQYGPSAATAVSMSVLTEDAMRDREGNTTINTTWFNVSAWNTKEKTIVPPGVSKGVIVEVEGRLRFRRYIDSEGIERSTMDVLAHSVKLLPADSEEPLQPERC